MASNRSLSVFILFFILITELLLPFNTFRGVSTQVKNYWFFSTSKYQTEAVGAHPCMICGKPGNPVYYTDTWNFAKKTHFYCNEHIKSAPVSVKKISPDTPSQLGKLFWALFITSMGLMFSAIYPLMMAHEFWKENSSTSINHFLGSVALTTFVMVMRIFGLLGLNYLP